MVAQPASPASGVCLLAWPSPLLPTTLKTGCGGAAATCACTDYDQVSLLQHEVRTADALPLVARTMKGLISNLPKKAWLGLYESRLESGCQHTWYGQPSFADRLDCWLPRCVHRGVAEQGYDANMSDSNSRGTLSRAQYSHANGA